MEMNACRIRAYILFLGRYCGSQDVTFNNFLLKDFSNLLIKRRTVIDAVLDTGASESVRQTYSVLLNLFANFMKSAFTNDFNKQVNYIFVYIHILFF